MAAAVGAVLAMAAGVLGRISGMDRDRAFYPTVTIVVASLYALFAVLGGSPSALMAEILFGSVFAVLAVVGFRRSLWLVAGALTGHGLFDFVHGQLVANPGVPPWWPAFCGTYDVVAGVFLAWLLASGRTRVARGRDT